MMGQRRTCGVQGYTVRYAGWESSFGKDVLNCPRFDKFSFWARRRRRAVERSISKFMQQHNVNKHLPYRKCYEEEEVESSQSGKSDHLKEKLRSIEQDVLRSQGYPDWFFPPQFSDDAKELLGLMLKPRKQDLCR